MTELRALVDGQSAALLTKDGVFMFSRVYFADGQFDLGDGRGRPCAGQRVLSAQYDPALGLRLHFTDYEAFVPSVALKVTWKRPS